jgi:hypothetical protein
MGVISRICVQTGGGRSGAGCKKTAHTEFHACMERSVASLLIATGMAAGGATTQALYGGAGGRGALGAGAHAAGGTVLLGLIGLSVACSNNPNFGS